MQNRSVFFGPRQSVGANSAQRMRSLSSQRRHCWRASVQKVPSTRSMFVLPHADEVTAVGVPVIEPELGPGLEFELDADASVSASRDALTLARSAMRRGAPGREPRACP